ncbi:hypothetical protein [Streptomyces bohaiensis]|uniref:DUF35 domain-containing protein n=1 Tax=Streptomyces bohaiensis TaxID=1431344 RepID=A0ABX1C8B6_9ACTN|nr:hypothetical protein [Streptomyces bohaiensis]NJQ14195.1 hypothetical protein [Streptomyces bohaiensis]
MTTPTPQWLAERLADSADAAVPRRCPRCGAPTLTARAGGRVMALDVRLDTGPLDIEEEIAALMDGRLTWHLTSGGRITWRHNFHRRVPTRHQVLRDHRCRRAVA